MMPRRFFLSTALAVLMAGTVTAAPAGLSFSSAGTFKIVQFADSHLCLPEAVPGEEPKAQEERARIAADSADLRRTIAAILEQEKPDLVVFTGDNVTTPPELFAAGWEFLTGPMVERHIPWVAVIGNHDPEQGRSSSEIMAALTGLPGSLTVGGPEALGGGGNFMLPVNADGQIAAVLVFMDSGHHADPRLSSGYAWISYRQIAWFREETERLTRAHHGQPLPALAFFHIPVPEYVLAWQGTGRKIGSRYENVCCPEIDSGLFGAMLETGSVMGVFTGHDHDNDYAADYHGICLAYGRKTGSFSYHHVLGSGARVIELQAGKRSFASWIRTADGEVVDRFVYPDSFLPEPEKQ